MPLKYQHEIDALGCDLSNFKPAKRPAYCFAFNGITDPRNFIPRAITVSRNECGAWGLSFYETEQKCRNKMSRLMKKNPTLPKKLGDHVAFGMLTLTDGISEDANSEGHFNLHINDGVNLKTTFNILSPI